MSSDSRITALRARIEQLTLLEMVAENRQDQLEELLDAAIAGGLDAETIRIELRLSEESLERLTDGTTPSLHERLGISQASAERLRREVSSPS